MKKERYLKVIQDIEALISGETDEIAVMSTVCCEVAHAFPEFNWVGFYRVTEPELLKVGPYQGGHGCLVIPFSKGVCGKAARENQTQLVKDVNTLPYHIACSSSTQSEIVVPVTDNKNIVRAVFDLDSEILDYVDETDKDYVEIICRLVGSVYKD